MNASLGQFPHSVPVTSERHHIVNAQVVFSAQDDSVCWLFTEHSYFWVIYNIKYIFNGFEL